MPKLVAALIRHASYHQLANAPSSHQPYPLTDAGQSEARTAARPLNEFLQSRNYSLCPEVDCSHMLRAWETASIIIETLSERFPSLPELNGFDALAERGVGSVANLTVDEIEAIVRNDPRYEQLPGGWKSDSHFRLPFQGAESLLEAGERVAAHLEQRMQELGQQATTDTVKLFVGHGAAFRHAAFHLGVLQLEQVAQLSMYHAQPVFLEYSPSDGWLHIAGEWKVRKRDGEDLD